MWNICFFSPNEALNIVAAGLMLLIFLSRLCHIARSLILVELLKNSIVFQKERKDCQMVKGKETLGIRVSRGDSLRQDNNVEEHGIESGCPVV